MSLTAAWNLHQSTVLKNKAMAAITVKARYTLANAGSQSADELAWARVAAYRPQDFIDPVMWAIANNSTVQMSGDEATDNDIQYIVDSEFAALVAIHAGA